ncbi:exodeoxyribonuclease VII large subunit [uncultured Megasphaera sp.]|uniref:exodeoxyribonuclease VII large subunit n=1 Tax=uncultured Megasphaera sp. TaxID=165188 RepID=UPI002803B140|nr:exodeoxyribonuclease VII large subunit [uncultured Megasphaera sp.]
MKYASVTDVVRRIKADIHGDYRLQSIAMEGNIIGLKRASNGHYYMNIRDEQCSIRAIVFRSRVTAAVRAAREGDHVIVIGAVNVYEKGGALSFVIEQLFSQGTGSLQAQYERIKNELAAQGYFDSSHKQELPRFPWRVGVVTSRTGAVLHDIYKIAGERNPYADIVLCPVPVQGDGADTAIAAAIEKMGKKKDLDVLIVGRGGGSMEDLWCFNSPAVVKAIYAANVPIITAIGHETDTTLADYAADVRAATPTHAAEMAFSDIREIELDLANLAEEAYEKVMARIDSEERRVEQVTARLNLQRYDAFLAMKETEVASLMEKAERQLRLQLQQKEGRFRTLQASLTALNPAALVRRGYGQLMQDKKIITDIRSISKEKPLQIQLVDGLVTADVKEVDIYGKND